MPLELESLRNSVNALASAITVSERSEQSEQYDQDTRDVIRAGVIQNFETAYELSWKMIARWLDSYIAPRTSKVGKPQLYRIAAEYELIHDVEAWMDYHKARNITSHRYGKGEAVQVHATAIEFVHDAKRLLNELESRND